MSARGKSRTFLGIQYLRALAAGLVVIWHACSFVERGSDLSHDLVGLGQSGVDIFFVISGFIIFYTTAVAPMSAREFMARRIVRIVPIYWFYTTLWLAAFLAAPYFFHATAIAPWHTVASYLFIPAYPPGPHGLIRPVLGVGWSLNFEMFFYAAFALVLSWGIAARLRAVVAIMLALVLLGALIQPDDAVLQTYSDPLVLEFVGGCAIGWMVIRGIRLPRAVCLALLALAVLGFAASFYVQDWPEWLRWGLPSILLVAGAAFYEADHGVRRVELLKRLGDATYSIYLSHIFAVGAFVTLWRRAGLPEYPHWVMAAAATVVALAIGWVAYVAIERRTTGILGAMLATRQQPRAVS